jgi:hypothetical protein
MSKSLWKRGPFRALFGPSTARWLMYYIDFRVKYSPPDSRSEQVRLFIEKLRSRKQSQKQLNQAAHALSLFFSMRSSFGMF